MIEKQKEQREADFEILNKAQLMLQLAKDGLVQPRLIDELIADTQHRPDKKVLCDLLITFRENMITLGYYP